MSVQDQETHPDANQRLCDFCNKSTALLYCRADSAKLCLKCDREVHSTNQLFLKHYRSLLCDACNFAPSTIFCLTDSAVLCQNCDWETHNNFNGVHGRRPIEGFNRCPCVSELLNVVGLEDLEKKSLTFEDGSEDGLFDFLVWETPLIVSLDDLIVSNDFADSGHSFQAMGVPPLPKNRNAACGKYKEDILSQLREMAKTEPDFNGYLEDLDLNFGYQMPQGLEDEDYAEPKPDISVPSYEISPFKGCDDNAGVCDEGSQSILKSTFIEMNHLLPGKDQDNISQSRVVENFVQEAQPPGIPADSSNTELPPKTGTRELNNQERDSALLRYKEKKKNRRYDRHIRYESRKVRAESRTRIKGRFAKIDR